LFPLAILRPALQAGQLFIYRWRFLGTIYCPNITGRSRILAIYKNLFPSMGGLYYWEIILKFIFFDVKKKRDLPLKQDRKKN
jgi:hypothetical protein